jgi:hypothetical protein
MSDLLSSISNLGLGSVSIPTIDPGIGGVTQSPNPSSGGGWFDSYMKAFNQMQNAAVDNPASTLSNLSGLNPNDVATGKVSFLTGNIAAFVIGVLCVGAGLLMFKTSSTVIVGTGKLAAKGASLVA